MNVFSENHSFQSKPKQCILTFYLILLLTLYYTAPAFAIFDFVYRHALNDVAVTKCTLKEVLDFDRGWRKPCVVLYEMRGSVTNEERQLWCHPPPVIIKPTVFQAPSLSIQRMRREST